MLKINDKNISKLAINGNEFVCTLQEFIGKHISYPSSKHMESLNFSDWDLTNIRAQGLYSANFANEFGREGTILDIVTLNGKIFILYYAPADEKHGAGLESISLDCLIKIGGVLSRPLTHLYQGIKSLCRKQVVLC